MLNKWLNLKNENLRLQHDLVQSREQYEDLAEELAAVNENYESLEKEVSKLREAAIDERERAMRLERDLAENRKQIRSSTVDPKSWIRYSRWVNQPRRIGDWDIEELRVLRKYNRRGYHISCMGAHQKVEPKELVRKYVGTYDRE